MKQVLAELHSLINDLEDQGLTAEASSLQDVFIRVAEEAETDDLANDVKAILESHPVAKVLEEIAKQMGGDGAGASDEDAQTSSFANMLNNSGEGDASGEDEATVRQEIIEAWRKHVDAGNMQAYSAARMATQQLRMKFPEAKDITSTDIKPFKEFPGEDLKRVFQLGPQDPYKHWNTAPGL